jgi:hypothetical protein
VTGLRKICRFLHREIAYFAVGLTVIYAVSGIAVNHIDSWNPSYRLGRDELHIEPVPAGDTAAMAATVLERLAPPEPVQTVWWASPDQLRIIVEGATYDVEPATGRVLRDGIKPRPLFRDLNYLHLNHGKGLWTWIADVYAGALAVLALTGIFLAKGSQGLAGRGGIWLALGVALPVAYLVVERYL